MWFNQTIMENKPLAYKIGLGLTFLTVGLFLVLVVLKLTGVIAWSWWWVVAPVVIPFIIVFITVLAASVIIGITTPPKYNQEDEENFNK